MTSPLRGIVWHYAFVRALPRSALNCGEQSTSSSATQALISWTCGGWASSVQVSRRAARPHRSRVRKPHFVAGVRHEIDELVPLDFALECYGLAFERLAWL